MQSVIFVTVKIQNCARDKALWCLYDLNVCVCFSSVQLLAPLHRALLITSPSWDLYVSQPLRQHAIDLIHVRNCKALFSQEETPDQVHCLSV